jgi:ABC-type branched-subunit amino acid transport system substrate-binding protein
LKHHALLIGALFLNGCAFFTGAKPAATAGDTIKIGLVSSFTGNNAGSGTTLLNSLTMASDVINASGALPGGKKVEILKGDDKSDGDAAVAVAKDHIAKGAVAIVGPNSSALAKRVLLEAAKPGAVAMISPSATSPDFSDPTLIDGGGYFFRTAPSDALQGKVLAARAKAKGFKKLAVVHVDNTYGNGLARVLEANFGAGTTDVAYKDIANPGDQATYDYGAIVGKALDAAPDAIVLAGYSSDASLIVNAWQRDGRLPKVTWLFTDSTYRQDFIDNVSDKAKLEGMVGTAPYTDPTFVDLFKARFPGDPGYRGGSTFDALALIGLAIASGKDATAKGIRDHLRGVSGPDGAAVTPSTLDQGLKDAAAGKAVAYTGWVGKIAWDEHGDMSSGKYLIWNLSGGKVGATSEVVTP